MEGYTYFAFISYSRKDERWAKWLQKKLEHYRLPSTVSRQKPDLPKKIKIFRDKTDLTAGCLRQELKKELDQSKFLIVICSPQSANSEWVGQEIEYFKNSGRQEYIIPFIVKGTPYTDNSLECYHQTLKDGIPEVLGINVFEKEKELYWIKKEKAFIKVISKMHGLRFDTLWNRRKRYLIIKFTYYITLTILLSGLIYMNLCQRPFDMRIALIETSIKNPALPFIDGKVICINGQDTILNKQLRSVNDTIEVKNLPGSLKGTTAHFYFEAFGYHHDEQKLPLQKSLSIRIVRNEKTYGTIHGYVRDAKNDRFVNQATVKIQNITSTTDRHGYFSILIPLNQQKPHYKAIVMIGNSCSSDQDVYPCREDNTLINTIYTK